MHEREKKKRILKYFSAEYHQINNLIYFPDYKMSSNNKRARQADDDDDEMIGTDSVLIYKAKQTKSSDKRLIILLEQAN